ncbi:MAG: methyl-accepting chemotaxis protein [Desulfocurvibacter africanus]
MSWNDLNLGRKLAIGFGAVLTLLLTIVFVSHKAQRENLDDAALAARFETMASELKNRVINHMQWTLALSEGLVFQNLANAEVVIDYRACPFAEWYYGQGRQAMEELDPKTTPLLNALEEPHRRIHESFQRIFDIYRQAGPGHAKQAQEVFATESLPSLNKFQQGLDALEAEISRRSGEIYATTTGHLQRNQVVLILISGAAILTGLLMALVIARSVTAPLREVVAAADRIAQGDLSHGLAFGQRLDQDSSRRRDEIGALQRSFGRMSASLLNVARSMEHIAQGDLTLEVQPQSERDIMGKALKSMTANLRELAAKTRDAVAVLASSVGQISASTAQLSASSSETATAVIETTATVSEARQTAQLSNEKARFVADSAQRVAEITRRGIQASEGTLEGMRLITDKMDFIAQNIVSLSEKSQDIGDITSAVRGLAEQSNILAVNASIEAARAGEEGKGFAVVAVEIRNLAERSKEAIRQIRVGLEEMQKATATSVMATEEGGKAVASGRDKASAAREAILALSESVRESGLAATQIAASSREELVGMDQVNTAMENIRQASHQNLDSANQLEESVRGISDLAKDLLKLVERYKV